MEQTTFEKDVEQGFEKGVERGERNVILRQLERRCGHLSDNVRQRLEAWPSDRLTDLADAILTAASLRDLGLAEE
jgi:hypothetical protein